MQLSGIRPDNHISGAASGELVGERAGEKEEEERGEQEEEQEESRQPKVARVPETPSKAEWDAHMLLHAEYRSWCPFCVKGKAHSNQHVASKDDEEKLGITISMDYTYMGSGMEIEDEDEGEGTVAHLVMHDNEKKA